jgi:carbon-monoxide dehydrogenase medium subunit
VKEFSYLTPGTTAEAVGLLGRHGAGAQVIAGGQSLLLAMKERTQRPQVLVSLARIADLSGIRLAGSGELVVGATTTYATLARAALTGWHAQIAAVAGNLADRPVRTMGTIGGALCAADPRFDMPALITGTGAMLHVTGPSGDRRLTPGEFFVAGGGTALGPSDILAEIHFPPAGDFSAVSFGKFRQRTFDAATASVLVAVRLDAGGTVAQARIAVGAVTPVPVLASQTAAGLAGSPATSVDPAQVAGRVVTEVLGDDGRAAPGPYRRELVQALTRKALASALTSPRS